MILLDGKKYSEELFQEYANKIRDFKRTIGFAIIWIGNNEESAIYVKNKIKKCEQLGIKANLYHLDEKVEEKDVIVLIEKLNNDKNIHGILLQSPVPKHIDILKCFNKISPSKDVDGFTNVSIGNLTQGCEKHVSCTPKGIIKLLEHYNISLKGKHVCIINRSLIVGKPLLQLFLNRDATVTICHSKTKDISKYTRMADIIVSAVGQEKFLTGEMIKDGAIVVDVGISRVNGKICGDVDKDTVSLKASYLTPVPGGIGPMTVAMIFDNLIENLEEENE